MTEEPAPAAPATPVPPPPFLHPDMSRYASLEAYLDEMAPRIAAQIKHEVQSRQIQPVLDLATYAIQGGKKLRPGLCTLVYRALGGTYADEASVIKVACVAELSHQSSIILDDVFDKDTMRRGKLATHEKFQAAFSVVAAGGIGLLGILIGSRRGAQSAELAVNMVTALMEGNAIDLAGIGYTEPEYDRLIALKTAYLFGGASKFGSIMAMSPDVEQAALWEFGLACGMAFQVVDDATDFLISQVTGMPQGALAQRLVTLPLIRLYDQSPDARPLLEQYRDHDRAWSTEDHQDLMRQVAEAGGVTYALEVAALHRQRAHRALDTIHFSTGGWCPKHAALLRLFPDYACDALLNEVPVG